MNVIRADIAVNIVKRILVLVCKSLFSVGSLQSVKYVKKWAQFLLFVKIFPGSLEVIHSSMYRPASVKTSSYLSNSRATFVMLDLQSDSLRFQSKTDCEE